MIKKAVKYMFNKAGYKVKKVRPKTFSISDKLIQCRIGNYDLWFDETHALPPAINNLIHYGTNVGRLGKWVHKKYDDMVLIDVGANVGDTIAFCRTLDHYPMVCVEGDDRYYKILEKNAPTFDDLSLVKAYVGEKNETINVQADAHPGTAHLTKTSEGQAISLNTLDKLIANGTLPRGARMLKIDTDGYDLKVLRGGVNYLKSVHPVLFFEYDRTLFEKAGDRGTDTLDLLQDLGYSSTLFYDNYGRFMMKLPLGSEQVYQLHNYICAGAFQYFDIALFHQEDEDIAHMFAQQEVEYFK